MHAEWKPTDRLEKLVTQINIGVIYAQYVNYLIPDQEMVDTFIMLIMKCDLFNKSYEKWHARPNKNKHERSNSFLERGGEPETYLRSHTAGKYGFGGTTTDAGITEADAAYQKLVQEFFFGVGQ